MITQSPGGCRVVVLEAVRKVVADLAESTQPVLSREHTRVYAFCFQTGKDGRISLPEGTREPTSVEKMQLY